MTNFKLQFKLISVCLNIIESVILLSYLKLLKHSLYHKTNTTGCTCLSFKIIDLSDLLVSAKTNSICLFLKITNIVVYSSWGQLNNSIRSQLQLQ